MNNFEIYRSSAGSGKTFSLVREYLRIALSDTSSPPRHFREILAITFTNKAAGEMKERVAELVGARARAMWVSTFHSLCARLLRREAPAIGLSRDFVIYDSSDQIAVVKQALKALDIDDKLIQPRAALSRISQAKNKMETPEQMKNSGWGLRDQQIARVYEVYKRVVETQKHKLD